jgi:hypothetical protein
MKTSIFSILLVLFILSSCKDESNPIAGGYDPNGDIFPMQNGYWWKYENYDLDSLGKIDESTITIDSMYVDGSAIKLDKDCKRILNFTDIAAGVGAPEELYFRSEGEIVYTLNNIFSEMMPIGDIGLLEDEWAKIIDPADNIWEIADIKDISIPILGDTDIYISNEKGVSKTITTLTGKQFPSQEYISNVALTMQLEYLGQVIPITLKIKMHNWYCPGIGLVMMEVDKMEIDAGIFTSIVAPLLKGYGFDENMTRSVRYIIDYNVK